MTHDDSYLTERLAERRRQVRSGVAGIGLLLALGWGLLLSYPSPESRGPHLDTLSPTTTVSQSDSLNPGVTTALR